LSSLLASQQGKPEADMALSKWFLFGADGTFEKDETLVTFADKASVPPSAVLLYLPPTCRPRAKAWGAEFATGYYSEVGVYSK
jgi:hypothetical protein